MAELKFRHNISADQLDEILSEFCTAVNYGEYSKLNYQVWRTLNRMSGKLYIAWFYPPGSKVAEIDICEMDVAATQVAHLLANDDSFGEFLFDRLLIHIEDYNKYSVCGENYISPPLMLDETGILSTATNSTDVYDTRGIWQSIEDRWYDELNTKVAIYDFDRIDKTVSKLCESATLAAPMNSNTEKENNIMKLNFDFGPVNPSLVRMSLYGLAVKNKAGTWVSYNAASGEIMDVDVLNFDGAKFLYRMPVAIKDIAVGDIVIHNSAPMFVVAIPEGDKVLTVVDTINGERKDIMLAKSPFGFNFATKVVNFLGNTFAASATAENPFGNLGLMMMLSEDDNSVKDMLPLMLMANGGNVDMSNPLMMYALMSGDNKMGDILPFMLMSQSMSAAPAHTCKCGGHCGEQAGQNG